MHTQKGVRKGTDIRDSPGVRGNSVIDFFFLFMGSAVCAFSLLDHFDSKTAALLTSLVNSIDVCMYLEKLK